LGSGLMSLVRYALPDRPTEKLQGTLGTFCSHDSNGNLTSKTTSGVTTSYSYDYFGRMTSVTHGGSRLQSMTYGPDGRRLSISDANGTRNFFYDGDDIIQVYDSDWSQVVEEFTHGPWVDEPLSMTKHNVDSDSASTYYLMKDRLGSIINILDCDENVKTTYSYGAFGQPSATYHSGQVDSIYRSTGRVFDVAIGSYYYRARYYDQNPGRFFSRDPLFFLQSLYIYCNNSPENLTDPFGVIKTSLGIGGRKAEVHSWDYAGGARYGYDYDEWGFGDRQKKDDLEESMGFSIEL